jgi:hypothetical protein
MRPVERLVLPRDKDEFALIYYNALTMWMDMDRLLTVFGPSRADLADADALAAAIRSMAARVPTYVTLKDVKKRSGHGQEDVYPVCQFEKLWGDRSAAPEVDCGFVVVPRDGESFVKDFKSLNLGVLSLEKGRGLLTLRAVEVSGKQVMEVRAVLLTLQK